MDGWGTSTWWWIPNEKTLQSVRLCASTVTPWPPADVTLPWRTEPGPSTHPSALQLRSERRGHRAAASRDPPAEADPLPVLPAASPAAADAAAVRWKQHKELSTWRLGKEEREDLLEAGGGQRGSRCGKRTQPPQVRPTYATVPQRFGCLRGPGCTPPSREPLSPFR